MTHTPSLCKTADTMNALLGLAIAALSIGAVASEHNVLQGVMEALAVLFGVAALARHPKNGNHEAKLV